MPHREPRRPEDPLSGKKRAAIAAIFLAGLCASFLPAPAEEGGIDIPIHINGDTYHVCVRVNLDNPCRLVH
jgi:hypothetical protein